MVFSLIFFGYWVRVFVVFIVLIVLFFFFLVVMGVVRGSFVVG